MSQQLLESGPVCDIVPLNGTFFWPEQSQSVIIELRASPNKVISSVNSSFLSLGHICSLFPYIYIKMLFLAKKGSQDCQEPRDLRDLCQVVRQLVKRLCRTTFCETSFMIREGVKKWSNFGESPKPVRPPPRYIQESKCHFDPPKSTILFRTPGTP